MAAASFTSRDADVDKASELQGEVTNSQLNSSKKIFRMTKYHFNRKINLYSEPPRKIISGII